MNLGIYTDSHLIFMGTLLRRRKDDAKSSFRFFVIFYQRAMMEELDVETYIAPNSFKARGYNPSLSHNPLEFGVGDEATVEEVYNAFGIARIVLAVGHHHYRCAVGVQFIQ